MSKVSRLRGAHGMSVVFGLATLLVCLGTASSAEGQSNPRGIAVDAAGNRYVVGYPIGNAAAAMTGAYGVTVTADGCSSEAGTTLVVVNAAPAPPTVASNSPVPPGGTLYLYASSVPGGTYSWAGPNGFSSTDQNPSLPNATSALEGTYTVTVDVAGWAPVIGSTVVSVGSIPPVVPSSLRFTTLAGRTLGDEDGPGPQARFALGWDMGLAADAAGNVTVADAGNQRIRKVAPDGSVFTLAGSGQWGWVEGPGAVAQFTYPTGLARDGGGNIYVADIHNHVIRRVGPDGTVSTYAGSGAYGGQDGAASVAEFMHPIGLAFDASGNLYVSESSGHRVRKITPEGTVSTLAGNGTSGFLDGPGTTAQFSAPGGLAVDASGNVYVADRGNHRIRKVLPDGTVNTFAGTGAVGADDGPGTGASFGNPTDLECDGSGNLFVADSWMNRIRKILPDGTVSIFAGGEWGDLDGVGTAARFRNPVALALDAAGNLYVAEANNARIRRIAPDATVTTLAGAGPGPWAGFDNGAGAAATFNGSADVAFDAAGNAYVPETWNNVIRKVTPAGDVTTFAGTGNPGWVDGPATSAEFNQPNSVVFDGAGNLYVSEAANHRLRKIAPDGTVSTSSGSGTAGLLDGPAGTARFNEPRGLARDASDNIYVADAGNFAIRRVAPDGSVTTVAGSGVNGYLDGPAGTAQFGAVRDVAVDSAGNLYVADHWNHRVRRVSLGGVVSTYAGAGYGFADGPGTAALFQGPMGLALDAAGNLFVSESSGSRIRRVAADGSVSTVGGDGTPGGNDGDGTSAHFRDPHGLAVAPDGSLWVAEAGNNAIRVGSAATLPDAATIDAGSGPVGEARQLGTAPANATSWTWDLVQQPWGNTSTFSSTQEAGPTFTPSAPGAHVFRLRAEGAAGAQSVTQVRFLAYTQATATVSGGGAICAGMPATVAAALTGTPPWSLTWSDGLVQSGITTSLIVRVVYPTSTTTYEVTSCSDVNGAGTPGGSATVTVSGTAPSAAIVAPGSAAPGQTGLVASVADAGFGATYAWTVANGTPTAGTGAQAVTFTAGSPGFVVLAVTVTTPGGCVSTGSWSLRAEQSPASVLSFTTLAGVPNGSEDGPPNAARFTFWEAGLARDAAGNIVVADTGNNVIRRVAPDGSVTTLAGTGETSILDGPASLARFANPSGVAVDAAGNVLVADQGNNRVRKVAPDGAVSTVAGSWPPGWLDGPGATAKFSRPRSVAIDGSGFFYVADFDNNRIRKIAPDGTVSTLAGTGEAGWADGAGTEARFNGPTGVALDAAGNVHVADERNNRVRMVTPGGKVTTIAGSGEPGLLDGPGVSARLNHPTNLVVSAAGDVYVADQWNTAIRRIDPSGNVSTLAGGQWGYLDATGTAARFANPYAVTLDGSGNLIVADGNNNRIRRVTPGGVVTTFSGSGVTPSAGFADGTGSAALFSSPFGVAVDAAGNVYAADQWNNRIRKVSPSGEVTTLAGTGQWGHQDGPGSSARFQIPVGLALAGTGQLVVSEQDGHRLRVVAPDGTVTTLAGSGDVGFLDGEGVAARFRSPVAVAIDAEGNAWVADRDNHAIRKVTPAGTVSTVAGDGTPGFVDGATAGARFSSPTGIAVDSSGAVWVADQGNNRVRKISGGTVTTVAGSYWGYLDGPGSTAQFRGVAGIAADAAGNALVTESGGFRVRKVAPNGTVSTVAGSGAAGGNDGVGTFARFRHVHAIAVGFDGTLVIADTGNNAIRLGRPVPLAVAATIDSPMGPIGQVRQLGTNGAGATAWTWAVTRRPAGSTTPLSATDQPSPTFTPDAKGLYLIRLEASNGSARAITEVQLVSAPAPTATVSGDATICSGHGTVIQAALTGTPPWSITWSDSLVQSGLTVSPATRTVSPTTTRTYTVDVVTDAIGLGTSSGSALVTITGVAPSATITAPTTVTPGQTGLTASVPDAGGMATYVWSVTNGTITDGDGTATITFSVPSAGWTVIAVVVTNGGCSSDGVANVWVGTPVTGPLTFTVLAGSPTGPGWFDGTGTAAKFSNPAGISVDAAGNVFVADTNNSEIRRIDGSGGVTTVAGSGRTGNADGPGAIATFRYPYGLAHDAAGNLLVADRSNHRIRRITPAGVVTTFAGTGLEGSADGPASEASFSYPFGLAVDGAGNVYVSDSVSNRIRKISPSGVVTSFAGSGSYGFADGPASTAAFRSPYGIAVDADGYVYVADSFNQRIRKVAPDGFVSTLAGTGTQGATDGPGTQATFRFPYGVAVDGAGNVYVADRSNQKIRLITPAGVVSTLAGSGTMGSLDGLGTAASFYSPSAISIGPSGDLFVADGSNSAVRRVTTAGAVTTVAGSVVVLGSTDAVGTAASFGFPYGAAVDGAGNVYVADYYNHKIRKVTPAGQASTLAGTGSMGSADGSGTAATFRSPTGVAVDPSGNAYVADYSNHKIRKITPAGDVSTLAGSGAMGSADGPGTSATFFYPWDVAVDGWGNVYVAERSSNRIRKVSASGMVTTLAGTGAAGSADGPGASATFWNPYGVAVDGQGVVYVADYGNHKIRRISPSGEVSTLAGSGLPGNADGNGTSATFYYPIDVSVAGFGAIWVSDRYNYSLRHVTPAGVVTTVAGTGVPGSADGTGLHAQFAGAIGLAVGYDGRLFVADTSGHAIRVGQPGLSDTATVDLPGGPVGQARQLDLSPQSATGLAWGVVRRPPGSVASLSATGIRNPTFTPDAPGLYTFRVTATDGTGRKGITTVSLVVCATPAAPVIAASSVVCASSPGNVASVPDAGAGATYLWQITNGTITAGAGTRQVAFTAGASGTVGLSVTVTPAGFCTSPQANVSIPVRALCLSPIGTPIVVGGTNTFNGSGFTAGSVLKLFVATASGPLDTNGGGWVPTSWTPTSLTWNVPADVPMGQGFGTVMVVNTDQGYVTSNFESQHLVGNPAAGLPTILTIGGVGISALDPSIPGAHVETVLAAGTTVTITGTGLAGPLVNLYTAAGNIGPLTPLEGGTSASFQVVIPADAPAGPGTFQVVNSAAGWTLSNAVDAVLRARITVTSVSVNGNLVTVTGDGFSVLTVINLFNRQGETVLNLGGLHAGGAPVIPITYVDPQHFTFVLPGTAQPGPAYVHALNPPYTPYTSSGTDPGGAFPIP